MEDWIVTSLGKCTKWLSGGTPSKANPDFWHGNIPWISAVSMGTTRIYNSELYISQEGLLQGSRIAPKGASLLLVRGGALNNKIPMGIAERDVAFNQDVKAIIADGVNITPKYLYIFLLSKRKEFLNLVELTGIGAGKLDTQRVQNTKICLPTIKEQEKIASFICEIDDKIELNRRQNATLEAMAQATFKDWFVDFGPVRAKMEGRQLECMSREIADLFPDRLDGEGKPEGWGWKPLSCFFELLGGGTPKTSVDEYWNGEIPWFSVVDTPSGSDLFVVKTQKNITKYGFENSSVKIVPQNCTIITARGTVGKLALTGVPMTINQSCYAAKASKYIGNFFIYFLLRKSISHLESNAHGSVFSTITRSTFETIYSDYPTESLCIAFEESAFPLMEKVKKNVLEVNTLTSLRDTLLPKLISGELRVPDAEKMVADIV